MSTPEQTFDLDEFRTTMLSEHNIKRAQHDTPALSLDDTLNAEAQIWAQNLLSTGQLQHDSSLEGTGENLYYISRQVPSDPPMTQALIDLYKQYYPDFEPPTDFTGEALATSAAGAWYSESADYSYTTTRSINGNAIGHFTQLIWKDSSLMGCGAAWAMAPTGNNVIAYVVCRYQSPGNYVTMAYGQSYDDARLVAYVNNVLPT